MSKMPEKLTKKELVKKGSTLQPTVHVGKEGLTEGIIEEVRTQVKRNKIVKVRVLPNADMEIKEVGTELAERAGVKCVETRGFTALMCEARLFEEKSH